MAIFDELTITIQVERLEEKPKASLNKHFVAIKAEGEAQLAFVKQLHDLDDVLAGVTDSDLGR
jgi:hypothetical protein